MDDLEEDLLKKFDETKFGVYITLNKEETQDAD